MSQVSSHKAKGVYPKSESLRPETFDLRLIELCGHCGSHSIVDDFETVPGIGREKYRKCYACGSRDIKTVEKLTPIAINTISEVSKYLKNVTEEPMSSKDKSKNLCAIAGCQNWGSFDKMCANHFREAHNMTYKQYMARRKAGETKEQIFGSVSKPANRETKPVKAETKAKERKTKQVAGEAKYSSFKKYLELDPAKGFKSIKDAMAEEHTAVCVDFLGHSDLLDKLTNMAKAAFRTEAQQILYLISEVDLSEGS